MPSCFCLPWSLLHFRILLLRNEGNNQAFLSILCRSFYNTWLPPVCLSVTRTRSVRKFTYMSIVPYDMEKQDGY